MPAQGEARDVCKISGETGRQWCLSHDLPWPHSFITEALGEPPVRPVDAEEQYAGKLPGGIPDTDHNRRAVAATDATALRRLRAEHRAVAGIEPDTFLMVAVCAGCGGSIYRTTWGEGGWPEEYLALSPWMHGDPVHGAEEPNCALPGVRAR